MCKPCYFTMAEALKYFVRKNGWSCILVGKYKIKWMKQGKYSTCYATWLYDENPHTQSQRVKFERINKH